MKTLNHPLLAACLVALAYGWFVLALCETRGGDLSRFVVAGGPGVDASRVPKGLTVTNTGGFDGAIYYRLALDPFPREATAFGITLDNPSYRAQRIGYPLLVWLFSWGHAAWVPALLVLVNWIALAAMAAIAASLVRHWGGHALWGIVVPLYPGFALSISRDLTEPVAAASMLAGVWVLVVKRSPRVAAAFLTYAVLTRETSLVLPAVLCAAYVVQRLARRSTSIAPVVFLVPIATYVLWQIALGAVWGVAPIRSVSAPASAIPFTAYWQFLLAAAPRHLKQHRIYFAEAVYWGLVVMTAAAACLRTKAAGELRLAWLAYLGLAATLGSYFWWDDFGFMRIFADLFVMSAVVILGSGRVPRWIALLTTSLLWQYLARHLVDVG